ncbi:hypothetical protein BT69DRAFT_1335535 [Atractiella rhizophila]|nr:hypothetical protein BT69DRAFT_1335535 [Atractiella rhizophila]
MSHRLPAPVDFSLTSIHCANFYYNMEASPNTDTSQWRIVGKMEHGYIIEADGEYYIIPQELVMLVLGRLLAQAI